MSKQDRQGVRTATDLEMKYHFGQAFSEMRQMLQTAESALATANNAQTALGELTDYVDTGLAGKAPAGYGLGLGTGDITQLTTAAQVDAAMEAGWYQYYGSNINGNGTAYGGILVVPSMWSVTQFFFCRLHYGSYMKRIYQSNAWNPWEWINPPMLFGEEYRTTERYNGKPVYMMAVKLEGGPNNGEKKVNHGVQNAIVFDVGGVAISRFNNTCLSLPWLNYITISASHAEVIAAASANYSSYNLHTWIKYYKTTD